MDSGERRRRPVPRRGLARRVADGERGVSRYYQLYQRLAGELESGQIAPGAALPSEPALCLRYGLSRTTVRRALARLEKEGRILRRRGSGTYARPQSGRARVCLELHRLAESLRTLDSRTRPETRQVGLASVPAALRLLAGRIGPQAEMFECVRRDRGGALLMTLAYVPDGDAGGLSRSALSRLSIPALLQHLGRQCGPRHWSFDAIPADQAAAVALGVPLGAPLLRARAAWTDRGGRVSAVVESLCRSDRLRLRAAGPGRQPGG